MTTLVTGDLHFSENPRDEYRHEFVGRLCKLLTKHKVRNLMILGDLTEEKDRHSAYLTNRVVSHILRLRNHCKEVYIDCGNHDYVNKGEAFFAFLGHLANVAWIEKPKTWDIPALGDCLILPHAADYKKEWKGLLEGKQYDWIFAHNTFDGAIGDNGRELVGIPQSVFGKHHNGRVISGDIHVPQKCGPITYAGAPYLVDFGDSYQPRVLLIKDGEVRSIKVDGPQKRLVEISSVMVLDQVEGINEGDMLKVRVQIHPDDQANWETIKGHVRDWGAEFKYNIWAVVPQVMTKANKKKAIQGARFVHKSDDDVMQGFAATHDVDDKTLAVGKKLARKV